VTYRFHGRFISESRARQLSNLKSVSKYITKEPSPREKRAAQAAQELRSQAARKGWETRLRAQELRSQAARKGWETRHQRERQLERESRRALREIAVERERAPAPRPTLVERHAPAVERIFPREEEIYSEEEDIPPPGYFDTWEEPEPEFEGEFSGFDYDLADYNEDYFEDYAIADIDDEDKYERTA
jgi:hypothetical protein